MKHHKQNDSSKPQKFTLLDDIQQTQTFFDSGNSSSGNSPPITKSRSSTLRQIGQYVVLREIGRGGMGTIYEAEHVFLRRKVAVKIINDSIEDNQITLYMDNVGTLLRSRAITRGYLLQSAFDRLE